MRKLVVPFLLFCQIVVAQAIEGGAFAVINDKDGYVNVRKEKSVHSKVLKNLTTIPLFLFLNMIRLMMAIGFMLIMKDIFTMTGSNGYIIFLK